jgi:peptidoglycan/xylan/chitin deacetylase (PgdA/CDA1 family)
LTPPVAATLRERVIRHRAAAVVLCYHHIAENPDDPLNLCVHPDRFRAQIEQVRSVADIVPLAMIGKRGAQHRVAITFDDGYADTAEEAVAILTEFGAPATVFVPNASLEDRHEFWWERLVHLVLDVPEPLRPALEVELDGRPLRVDVRTAAGRLRAFRALNDRLLRLPPEMVDAALESVAAQLGGSIPRDCEEHRKMSTAQLEEIDRRDLVEVGGHTRTHALLSVLDEPSQTAEIAGGRAHLESIVSHPVTSFAYPYGYAGSFDDRTVQLVRDAGYARACTTVTGPVPRRMDTYRIPRYQVRDWDGESFLAQLSSWLAA